MKLIKDTNAYRVIAADKKRGTLSHAYLVSIADKGMEREYLKCLAKLIMCDSEDYCDECRICRLISRETHSDNVIYPKNSDKLNVSVADEIVEKTIIRPLELDRQLFVVCSFEDFASSQNKLLKTLEEPPENVILLLGSTNDAGILQTVKSRTKKVSIPLFTEEKLFDALESEYEDKQRLRAAILISGGKASLVADNYNRGDLSKLSDLCVDVLLKLNSSRDEARIAKQLSSVDIVAFTSMLKSVVGTLIEYKCGAISRLNADNTKALDEKYSLGALSELVERLSALERAEGLNANKVMTVDRLLFSILEGRHRWQKL